jgi:hypothetical protein
MEKTWKKIKSKKFRFVFACKTNDCEMNGEEVVVSISSCIDGGMPICSECDREMDLKRTEILVKE